MICLLKCGFSTVRLNYRRLNTQFSDRVVMKRQVHWQLRQVEKLLASECQVVLQVSIRSAGTCDKRPIFHDIHIHKYLHMNIDTIYLTIISLHSSWSTDCIMLHIHRHICVSALFDGQNKTHIICCTFRTRERHRQCKQCRRGSWHFSIGRVALTERGGLTSQIRGVFHHSQPVRWGLLDFMSAVPPPSPFPSPFPSPSPFPPPDLNCKL